MDMRTVSEGMSARRGILIACMLAILALWPWNRSCFAYEEYSENRDATNCRACHGDFRAAAYVSPVDGQNWGNLHNLHRTTMLSGDCDVCHGASTFPVILNVSAGGTGLDPIGCMGCHGRAEDDVPGAGYGAGLRQHHQVAGETICSDCHDDADPANYTAVGESTLPPYYANPGTNHPAMPNSACNSTENFAGAPQGLDNDGDDLYDLSDGNCATPVEYRSWGTVKSLFE